MSHMSNPTLILRGPYGGALSLRGYRIDQPGEQPSAHLELNVEGDTGWMIAGSLDDLGRLAATVFEAIAALEHARDFAVPVDIRGVDPSMDAR
jgi:hypothetical protein